MAVIQSNYEKIYEQIQNGWGTACLNENLSSNEKFRPSLISNDYRRGRKVFSVIEDELKACDEFFISVAFITMSGIVPFLMTFEELERRGIRGKILTTDYLNFSEPEALAKIQQFENIELKMYKTGNGEGFHTKGYIFDRDAISIMIVGSSNLTSAALTKNKEWNTRFVSSKRGELAKRVSDEFTGLWEDEKSAFYSDYRDEYEIKYKVIKEQRRIAATEKVVDLDRYRLEPNKMQIEFLDNLKAIWEKGENRALLISATGTGKSYASAFAMREANPEKALFLVHREDIARQAMESYGKVFGKTKTRGLLTGNSKDYDADILFATMQTVSKDETLEKFSSDYFDCIVIDEAHRAGAPTYQKIIDHFKPEFYLGMTASPERTDDFDIFELFNHNIACEIRLQDALSDDLLCPFHYFGISDIEFEGKIADDKTEFKNFTYIERHKRAEYVLKKAEFYGYSGDRLRGLVFCSRIEEADFMAEEFRNHGYRTISLGGKDSPSVREESIDRLMKDESDDALDYIFTVDIFNEGVDIPAVNQIIMLRPTESPIIFVQQLGRGLRKADEKDYVVIIDFIGNYTNNYLIPTALSGDRTYNKDNMRRYVQSGNRIIPGASTIHFDPVARKKIFESIDTAKTNTTKLIRDSYKNLKYKMGRIPDISDFKEHGEIEISKIFDKFGSYHNFLKKYEEDYEVEFKDDEEKILEYLSTKIARAKRPEELVIIKLICDEMKDFDIFEVAKTFLSNRYGCILTEIKKESITRNLSNQFVTKQQQDKFKACIFAENIDGSLRPTQEFIKKLRNPEFRSQVIDICEYGIDRYESEYSDRYKDTAFVIGEKYSYEDVCHLLDWKDNLTPLNIGGYFYDERTKTLPVFINYEKSDDAVQYNDRFISQNKLIALSKHPRKIDSPDANHIYKRKPEDRDNKIYLFVRKNKDDKEAKEFYFLGEIEAEGSPNPVIMKKEKTAAFEIIYRLETPVREDLYDYITE